MTPSPADQPRKSRARDGWRQDDVRKAVQGAIAGGMPVGRIEFSRQSFALVALDDSKSTSEADRCAQLMDEAFGEGGGD